jgi:hemerythrin-like domain-containing protein
MKCTDLLIQDHKIILRALDVLQQMARRVEEGNTLDREDVEAILRFLRAFADDHHQVKEESALFPELRRTCCTQDPALKQMLFEHDQERSLVEGMEDALYTKKHAEFVHFADRLVSLIRNHIRKEDTILFDIVDRLLAPEQDEKVVSALKKFIVKAEWFADLRRLEWKYMRKGTASVGAVYDNSQHTKLRDRGRL